MNQSPLKYLLWLLLSLMFLVAMMATEISILNNTKKQEQENYKQIQFLVNEKEAESKDFIYLLLKDTTQLNKKWMDNLELARRQQFVVNVFKNDTLVWWSDQSINGAKYLPKLKEGFVYQNTNNGAYWLSFISKGNYKIAVFYQIKTNYQFQNQYIQNHFNPDLSFLGSALFSPSPIPDFYNLKDRKGKYLCSIQIFGAPKKTPLWLQIIILATILAIARLFHEVGSWLIKKHFILGTLVFIGLTQTARWLFLTYGVPVFVYNHPLFKPDIYASSTYNPSLGDFIVAVLLLLWYLVLIKNLSLFSPKKKLGSMLHLGFAALVTMVLADAAFDSIKSLVFDSQISFEVKNIYTINLNTFLGLMLAFLILLCTYLMLNRLYLLFIKPGIHVLEKLIVIGLVFYFLEPYLVIYLFERNASYIYASNLLILSLGMYIHFIKQKLNRFQQYFLLILLLSLFTSLTINYYNSIREQSRRVLYASKLIAQNDVNAEYFLADVEKKITSGKLVKEYYLNAKSPKSQFLKKLRQLYFSGYLSKYNISIYDYDSVRQHYHQRNPFTYDQVQFIYDQLGSPTINKQFRYLKTNAYLKGYLGRFVIRNNGKLEGTLFVHLQPKLQQDETRFDELLIDGFKHNRTKQAAYSYAIYRDLQLLSQSGEYAYRTTYTWDNVEDKVKLIEENGYSHLLFKESDQLLVVVSKKSADWYEPFGLFSLSFTFFTLLLILIILVYVVFNNRWVNRGWLAENRIWIKLQWLLNKALLFKEADIKLIRTQIQLGIVLIVFVTLSTTAYFTISFITSQNVVKQNEKLVKKMRSVVNAVENESIEVNFKGRQTETEASINQIADFYETDISFFNPQGSLVASTIKKVYDDGIVAPIMNPEAYFHLHNLRESQFLQKEAIATFQYTGAYAPVFMRGKQLLGFIQLPDFYQNSDLNSEISSIMVGFINLYALMFLVIGILAWLVSRNISYPLILIQKQLSQTTIGKKNEPINWERKDEIGELVKEYNRMIDQLQASAEKLAQSEREGAWRDIARQIAHEIKNPLTPMKLSVQHLERAWNDKSPKLPETFSKVTKTLITQIDILSDLATEFSSFAKMPVPQYEEIQLDELIGQLVLLHEQTFEGSIHWKCEPGLILTFDRGYITRTLTNLIKNGTQAIPEDRIGEINIKAYTENNWVHLTVADNGTGIPENQHEKIFMPYFSTKVIGMGLGLPIVKNMIESGGGKIWFETADQIGTTFHVLLPLKHEE